MSSFSIPTYSMYLCTQRTHFMFWILVTGGVIISYLLGAIPSSVWYGKAFYGTDVREFGSGNAGATNTFRVLGKKAGSIVMAADILKGFVATSLPKLISQFTEINTNEMVLLQITFGMIAVAGHIFPIYINFKGGKGVASLLGMVLAINPPAAGVCVLAFLVIFLISKYVSLGSMVAGIIYASLMFVTYFNPDNLLSMKIFGVVTSTLLIYTHRKNISRLINKEENKANFSFTKKK
jgi:glycerol-3-phosphate acyltransferase PlsY